MRAFIVTCNIHLGQEGTDAQESTLCDQQTLIARSEKYLTRIFHKFDQSPWERPPGRDGMRRESRSGDRSHGRAIIFMKYPG